MVRISSARPSPSLSRAFQMKRLSPTRARRLAGSGVSLLLCALPAAAQTTSSNNLPSVTVTGESDQGYAAKRSTTATKTDTLLRDTPQSISVITSDDMRDRAVQSVAEAARYVPGVRFAQGEGNRETPIFRGISTTGDFFIDGVRTTSSTTATSTTSSESRSSRARTP